MGDDFVSDKSSVIIAKYHIAKKKLVENVNVVSHVIQCVSICQTQQ